MVCKSCALTTRPRRLLRCFFFLREDSVLCNNQWLQISDASNIVVQFFDSSCVVSRVEKSWFWLKPQSILVDKLNGLCIVWSYTFENFIHYFSVHLKASVVLSQEHPTTPPLFSITVTCGKTVIRDSFTKVWICFEFLTIQSPNHS